MGLRTAFTVSLEQNLWLWGFSVLFVKPRWLVGRFGSRLPQAPASPAPLNAPNLSVTLLGGGGSEGALEGWRVVVGTGPPCSSPRDIEEACALSKVPGMGLCCASGSGERPGRKVPENQSG